MPSCKMPIYTLLSLTFNFLTCMNSILVKVEIQALFIGGVSSADDASQNTTLAIHVSIYFQNMTLSYKSLNEATKSKSWPTCRRPLFRRLTVIVQISSGVLVWV